MTAAGVVTLEENGVILCSPTEAEDDVMSPPMTAAGVETLTLNGTIVTIVLSLSIKGSVNLKLSEPDARAFPWVEAGAENGIPALFPSDTPAVLLSVANGLVFTVWWLIIGGWGETGNETSASNASSETKVITILFWEFRLEKEST